MAVVRLYEVLYLLPPRLSVKKRVYPTIYDTPGREHPLRGLLKKKASQTLLPRTRPGPLPPRRGSGRVV